MAHLGCLSDGILQAVCQFKPFRAPGPNDMHAVFNKKVLAHHWQDICVMIKNFPKSGHLLKKINRTHITLMPKNQNPEKSF